MFCNKCGKELEVDALFCNSCGIAIKKENTEADVIKAPKATSVNKAGMLTKIALIIMSLIIFAMGFYIVVNIVGHNDDHGNTNIGTVEDKNVDIALSALCSEWKKLYSEGNVGNGYLEIIHTRVINIAPSEDDAFFSLNRGDEIECIVEFVLLSDYFGSTPYYHNANTCDTVVIYKDGTTKVSNNIFRIYSSYTYDYDYSDLITNIKDYGTVFNQTIDIK